MTNNKALDAIIHPSYCFYESEIDLINKLITIYAITHMSDKKQLRPFEKDVLNYYVRFGYSTETKKRAQKELDKSNATITQATFYLSQKGYLVKKKNNFSKKKLNKDLESLRQGFLNGKKQIWALGFKLK